MILIGVTTSLLYAVTQKTQVLFQVPQNCGGLISEIESKTSNPFIIPDSFSQNSSAKSFILLHIQIPQGKAEKVELVVIFPYLYYFRIICTANLNNINDFHFIFFIFKYDHKYTKFYISEYQTFNTGFEAGKNAQQIKAIAARV